MARYARRRERGSWIAVLFPLFFVLYTEIAVSVFARMEITSYKILFALAAGSIALFVSRLIPIRVVGFILQSLLLLAYWLYTCAQFVHYASRGVFFSLFSASDAPTAMWVSALRQNWLFLLVMLPPLVLQFTLQRGFLLHRAGLIEAVTGSAWMDTFGALLLAAAILLIAIVLPLRNEEGSPSPRRLMDIEFSPRESVETFGVLPTFALDVKYNALGIHGEEIIHHWVVNEDGTQMEISADELPPDL